MGADEVGTLTVRVIDGAGAGVSDVSLSVRGARGSTGRNGSGEVRGLPDGHFTLLSSLSGHVREETPIEIVHGRGEVRVVLHPGARLAGVVVDDAGAAIVGAAVRVLPENDDAAIPWEATTDATGHFGFDTLRLGPQRIDVSAEGFEASTRRAALSPREGALRIALRRAGSIIGHVVDASSHPVDGAEVVLAGSGVWPPRSARSDATGAFALPGVPGGVYELRARRGPLVGDPREGLLLAPGATADVQLVVVAGRTLHAVVWDADADGPLPGAQVVVAEDSLSFAPRAVRAGARGEFDVEGLRAIPHRVSVRAEGYTSIVARTVEPGGEPMRLALRRAATLAGVVVDQDGEPVRGARVEVSGTDESGAPVALSADALAFQSALFETELAGARPLREGGELGVTSGAVPPIPVVPTLGNAEVPLVTGFATDALGRFHIGGVPPGRIQVVARDLDHGPAVLPARLVVAGAVIDDLRLVLPDGGRIDGRVVDARGFPGTAVRIEARAEREPLPRSLLAGADGTFELRGLVGRVTVTAYPSGEPPVRADVEVPAGRTVPVVLTLTGESVTLRGRVVDSAGFPVAGARIRVRSQRARTPLVAATESADDGTFSLDGLSRPPLALDADHPDYALAHQRVTDVSRELEVRLADGAAVRGLVVDAADGSAIAGARLTLSSETLRFAATSNRAGAFVFDRVPEGGYTLLAEADAHVQVVRPVRVSRRAGQLDDVELDDVELGAGGSVSGEVRDAVGDPVSGAEVAVGAPPDWDHAVRTDPQGRFTVPGVVPGIAVLTGRHPAAGEAGARAPVRVFPGEDSPDAQIRLPLRFDPSRVPEASANDGTHASIAARLALGEDGSVVVQHVNDGSAADHAGLREGDVITAVDEQAVHSLDETLGRLRGAAGVDALVDVRRGTHDLRLVVPRE